MSSINFIFVFAFFLNSSVVLAQACGLSSANTDCVTAAANKQITGPSGPCQKITNGHTSGKALLIPLKATPAGPDNWAQFLAHLPVGVTAAACVGGPPPPPPPPFCAAAYNNSDVSGACVFSTPSLTLECLSVSLTRSYCAGPPGNSVTYTMSSRTWVNFKYDCVTTTSSTTNFSMCP